jgi:hypothetical protein
MDTALNRAQPMTSYPHTDGSRATWNGDSRGPRYCKDDANCEGEGGRDEQCIE